MIIPNVWKKVRGECESPDCRRLPIEVWGWGDDETAAQREGSHRLQRLIDRIRSGDAFPHKYAYGSRPLREEIIQRFEGTVEHQPDAIITRNRYGALVLNTAHMLFLDVDVEPTGFGGKLRSLFGKRDLDPTEAALDGLRHALRAANHIMFRIYRTAAGLRAIAIDHPFDPASSDAAELMRSTKTDDAYLRLCKAQQCFRARLTPKPWRCGCHVPPGDYPREDESLQRRFESWAATYESASRSYATCAFIESIGNGQPTADFAGLIDVHDELTRARESLPLA